MEVEVVWHCLLFGMQHICAIRVKMAHYITVEILKD